jgi:hypothetical protein
MPKTTTHRKGGSTGANGYGEYQVRYASERQKQFIQNLLATKEVPSESDFTGQSLDTLNVQGAKDVITYLLQLPNKAGIVIPPTEKQLQFAQALVTSKEGGQGLLANVLQSRGVHELTQLSRGDVSAIINSLKLVKDAPMKITEVGAYLLDGTIYSIRQASESKKWSVWTYSDEVKKYVRNDVATKEILKKVEPTDRLTLELAIKYSAQVGICVHCGRTLTLLKSVAGGMGAICAKKYH